MMEVTLTNEGPCTIELESPQSVKDSSAPSAASAPKSPPVLLLLRAREGSYGCAGLRECERRGLKIIGAKTVVDGGDGLGALAVLVSGASGDAIERTLMRAKGDGQTPCLLSMHEGLPAARRFFAAAEICG